ncbi:MAG: stress protein [Fusobacteriia bacterium 4572_132]|nr:MAG: stress protein [Fusobacteriia bacterium 4572_132]
MGVNLSKGARVSLTKDSQGLKKIIVGLGWDEATKKKGFFSALLGGGANIDCDASILMLDNNEKLKETVYYGKLKSSNESIIHTGDNLTGEGEGDDEQIKIDLEKVPSDIGKMIVVINIYDCKKRNQDFGMIKNAFVRVVDQKDGQEMLKYNLTENYNEKTAIIVSEIYRNNGEWKFAAIGEGTRDYSLKELQKRYL